MSRPGGRWLAGRPYYATFHAASSHTACVRRRRRLLRSTTPVYHRTQRSVMRQPHKNMFVSTRRRHPPTWRRHPAVAGGVWRVTERQRRGHHSSVLHSDYTHAFDVLLRMRTEPVRNEPRTFPAFGGVEKLRALQPTPNKSPLGGKNRRRR